MFANSHTSDAGGTCLAVAPATLNRGRRGALAAAAALALLALVAPRAEAATTPTIPSWVTPGRVVQYAGYSGDVVLLATTKVTAVSRGVVSATTVLQDAGNPETTTDPWACNAAGSCVARYTSFQFWVDPNDPIGSTRAPNNQPYVLVGKMTFTDPWKRQWTVGVLNAEDPLNGVRYTTYYQLSTGLIVSHSETYPSQATIVYFKDF